VSPLIISQEKFEPAHAGCYGVTACGVFHDDAQRLRWTIIKMASKHLLHRTKTEGGLEKQLANPGNKKKITKTTHAGRRQETKWEISIKNYAKPYPTHGVSGNCHRGGDVVGAAKRAGGPVVRWR
jgi:hypothetical protein